MAMAATPEDARYVGRVVLLNSKICLEEVPIQYALDAMQANMDYAHQHARHKPVNDFFQKVDEIVRAREARRAKAYDDRAFERRYRRRHRRRARRRSRSRSQSVTAGPLRRRQVRPALACVQKVALASARVRRVPHVHDREVRLKPTRDVHTGHIRVILQVPVRVHEARHIQAMSHTQVPVRLPASGAVREGGAVLEALLRRAHKVRVGADNRYRARGVRPLSHDRARARKCHRRMRATGDVLERVAAPRSPTRSVVGPNA